jgi:hypothetical protein
MDTPQISESSLTSTEYSEEPAIVCIDGNGLSEPQSITIVCIRIGNVVTITIPQFTVRTNNTTIISTTTLPEAFRPRTDTTTLCTINTALDTNSNLNQVSTFFLSVSGLFMFSCGFDGGNFKAGISGLDNTLSVTYIH